MDREILAYGPKISNLFTYTTICTSKEDNSALYATSPSESLLWHHRLAHTNYHTIEKMAKEDIAIGFSPIMKIEGAGYTQCPDCPYGKQTRAPFKKVEAQPLEIGDTIVSDLCGPFCSNYRVEIDTVGIKNLEYLANRNSSVTVRTLIYWQYLIETIIQLINTIMEKKQ